MLSFDECVVVFFVKSSFRKTFNKTLERKSFGYSTERLTKKTIHIQAYNVVFTRNDPNLMRAQF